MSISTFRRRIARSHVGTHHEVVDVFACQISGRKRWQIYDPIIRDPIWFLKTHQYSLDREHPCMDVVLEPGDVLYMRRGDPHNVRCVGDEPSLHVNFRVIPTTRRVFLDWLVQEAAEDPTFRSTISYDFEGLDNTPNRVEWVTSLLEGIWRLDWRTEPFVTA